MEKLITGVGSSGSCGGWGWMGGWTGEKKKPKVQRVRCRSGGYSWELAGRKIG